MGVRGIHKTAHRRSLPVGQTGPVSRHHGSRPTIRREDDIERLLDANANRSREGLRVLEDTARFLFEDAVLARKLRSIRHRLDQTLRESAATWVLKRQVESDPGRTNPSTTHSNLKAIWASNFKRVSEALRVLEEYGRLKTTEWAPSLQSLRFEVYRLEKKFYERAKRKSA